MRSLQRLFTLYCMIAVLLMVTAAFTYAQEGETPTPEATAAAAEVVPTSEAAGEAEETETAEEVATAPPGITLLIFGIGATALMATGTMMILREHTERRQGKTPSL